MEYLHKTKEELIIELQELQLEHNSLKELCKKNLQEIKQAEKKLRKSEEKYRLLIDKMPDGVYKTTSEGVFVNANPSMFKMLGYDSIEELMSIDIKTQLYFKPSERESLMLKEKNKELGVYRLKKKDGSEIWVEDHGWLNYDKTTNVLYHEGIIRDITERKKAEETLQESEKRFRLLYENAPLAYQSLNKKGCLIDVNPTWLNTLGYKKEEVLGKQFGEFMTPQSAELIYTRFPKFIAEGEIHQAEFEMLRKDGSSLFVSYEGKIGNDEFGNFKQTHCIFSDITERKLAEEKMRSSKQLIEGIINTIPVRVFWKDKNLFYLGCNASFALDAGFSDLKEIIGKNDYQMGWSEQADSYRTDDKYVIETGFSKINIEEYQTTPEGNQIILLTNKIPLRDSNGNITGVLGTYTDISERKEIEKELINAKEKAEESERKLIEAQALSHVGSWEYMVASDTVTWSKELFNIFERSYDLPAPKYSEQQPYYTKESFTILDKAVQNCVQHEIPYEIELDIITESGKIKQIISKGTVNKDKNNTIIGAYGTAQEITQKKIIENELIKAKEKAEESDRLKSAFLANMSHEIRTPMNGILGFSELLKTPNLSGEKQQQFIDIIEKSGKRMLNIINDIVDISKIEAGLMKLDIKESNINEQIEYIYTFFKPEVEAKGMQFFLKKTLSPKEAIIKTDREKLFAILTNLVKNAIKYSNKGSIEFGYVLKTGNKSINQIQNAALEFFVKDTGIGIPKDRQEAVFERFIQADITDKMARQGAGLGLSITKAYVEMLGGKIWVESEQGKGSAFYFTLPYTIEIKEKNSNKGFKVTKHSENKIKNLTILIAEDDEVSALLISENVNKFSNKIITVSTGKEAVAACRKNPNIDLILMDIQMPEKNGYEATREIRQFNNHVIIIAQTAYGLSGDMEKSLNAGCNDYIKKPIDGVKLESLIQKYFN